MMMQNDEYMDDMMQDFETMDDLLEGDGMMRDFETMDDFLADSMNRQQGGRTRLGSGGSVKFKTYSKRQTPPGKGRHKQGKKKSPSAALGEDFDNFYLSSDDEDREAQKNKKEKLKSKKSLKPKKEKNDMSDLSDPDVDVGSEWRTAAAEIFGDQSLQSTSMFPLQDDTTEDQKTMEQAGNVPGGLKLMVSDGDESVRGSLKPVQEGHELSLSGSGASPSLGMISGGGAKARRKERPKLPLSLSTENEEGGSLEPGASTPKAGARSLGSPSKARGFPQQGVRSKNKPGSQDMDEGMCLDDQATVSKEEGVENNKTKESAEEAGDANEQPGSGKASVSDNNGPPTAPASTKEIPRPEEPQAQEPEGMSELPAKHSGQQETVVAHSESSKPPVLKKQELPPKRPTSNSTGQQELKDPTHSKPPLPAASSNKKTDSRPGTPGGELDKASCLSAEDEKQIREAHLAEIAAVKKKMSEEHDKELVAVKTQMSEEHDKEIAALKSKLSVLKKELGESDDKIDDMKKQMQKKLAQERMGQEEKFEKELKQLRASHRTELKRLQEEHQRSITERDTEHRKVLSSEKKRSNNVQELHKLLASEKKNTKQKIMDMETKMKTMERHYRETIEGYRHQLNLQKIQDSGRRSGFGTSTNTNPHVAFCRSQSFEQKRGIKQIQTPQKIAKFQEQLRRKEAEIVALKSKLNEALLKTAKYKGLEQALEDATERENILKEAMKQKEEEFQERFKHVGKDLEQFIRSSLFSQERLHGEDP